MDSNSKKQDVNGGGPSEIDEAAKRLNDQILWENAIAGKYDGEDTGEETAEEVSD